MNYRQLQSQRNGNENDDDIKFPLAYIRKIQNTANIETTISTKAAVGRRRLVVSIKKSELYIRLI